MDNDYRLQFAIRLRELCDDMGAPGKPFAREKWLAEIFGVSSNGARKWLLGEAYPCPETLDRIVVWANASYEWLMTGRGLKRPATQEREGDQREEALLRLFRESDQQGKDTILRTAEQESQAMTETVSDVRKSGAC